MANKKPAMSRRGKSVWKVYTYTGQPKIVSGQTSGGIDRAIMKYNAAHGGFNSGMGTRKTRTGYLTGGGF